MRTLRGRFILSHLLPTLLVVPLVGILLIYLLETQVQLVALSEDITEKANLIAQTLADQPEILNDANKAKTFVSGVSVYLDEQVLLFGPNGEVLAATELLPGQELNLQDLADALAGEQDVQVTYGLVEQRAVVFVPVTDINQQLVGIVGITETLAGTAAVFGRLRWLVAVILLLEIVLGSIVGFVLAVRLERPISRAATAVIDIAHGQRIDPIPEEGPAEIRGLSVAVNTLSERLRLLEETRRRLLANIVHELGRPLGAMRSAIHVLRHGAGDDPEIREELLAGVENELKRMQPLLDDLAQIHGQVLGTFELHRRPTPLSEWLPPLLLSWRTSAQDKGLHWQAEIPENLPTLDIDPDRLAQAVGNLCSNAIKYTSPGGSITVTAGADEKEVWIRVSDTGPGIVAQEQTRVFEPFFRSRQERRFPQGLGLGLTIARDVVEAHDGRLELASTPGDGSQFTIYLPRN